MQETGAMELAAWGQGCYSSSTNDYSLTLPAPASDTCNEFYVEDKSLSQANSSSECIQYNLCLYSLYDADTKGFK